MMYPGQPRLRCGRAFVGSSESHSMPISAPLRQLQTWGALPHPHQPALVESGSVAPALLFTPTIGYDCYSTLLEESYIRNDELNR